MNAHSRHLFRRCLSQMAWLAPAITCSCTAIPGECELTDSCGTSQGGASDGGRSASGGVLSAGGRSSGGDSQAQSTGGATDGTGASGGEGGTIERGGGSTGGSEPDVPPGLAVSVPGRVRVRTGGSAEVAIEIERKGSLMGPLNASISGLPKGVIGSSELVPGGADQATLTLIAADDASPGGPVAVTLEVSDLDGEATSKKVIELVVAGKPGSPDTSFASGGLLRVAPWSLAGMGVDAERRVWLGGSDQTDSGFVARVSSDGATEAPPEFAPPDVTQGLEALVVDAGRVWVSLRGAIDSRVARLSDAGEVVPAFGQDGWATPGGHVNSIVSRRAGGAWLHVSATPEVVLLQESGEVDPTFQLFSDECVGAISEDSEGRLLVQWCDATETTISMSRVLTDGSLDETFGDRGYLDVTVPDAVGGAFRGFAPLGSGHVLGAMANNWQSSDQLVFRLDESGTLDSSFGIGGELIVSGMLGAFAVVPIPSGFLVHSTAVGGGSPPLLFYDLNGAPLSEFGDGGKVILNELGGTLGFTAPLFPLMATVDFDAGRLVVAGALATEGEGALLRLWL